MSTPDRPTKISASEQASRGRKMVNPFVLGKQLLDEAKLLAGDPERRGDVITHLQHESLYVRQCARHALELAGETIMVKEGAFLLAS